jgi:enediyne biosynthesis protein E5
MAVLHSAPDRSDRLQALRRFAVAITVLNVLGHTVLGFEQSWAQPLVALATAYAMELVIEAMNARAEGRRPGFAGGIGRLVDFLLPAHITGLAVAMLLYANDRLAPIAFATTVAIGSKFLVRVPVNGGSRHVLNPSNTGISVTLLLFPWIGIAPPYMFTENLTGPGDWLLPTIIVISGTYLNTQFTRKMPLILGWLGGFVFQAVLRSQAFGTPLIAALLPMTGMAFLLFTFYMVTDPGTTPSAPSRQFAFGVTVAVAYAVLMLAHVVFGLFFALLATCLLRGIGLVVLDRLRVMERDARLRGLEA